MKRILVYLIATIYCFSLHAQYQVSSGNGSIYEYDKDLGGTNISKVYILNGLSGAMIKYESASSSVKFYYYTLSLSDRVAVPVGDISAITSGGRTTYTISNLIDSKGYYADEGSTPKVAWIIDYSQHHPILNSIEADETSFHCEENQQATLKLKYSISDDLFFYGISGIKKEVRREYTIEYEDLIWDKEQKAYIRETIEETNVRGVETIIDAPLLSTQFTLKGDQIALELEINNISITSLPYDTKATIAEIVAEKENPDGSINDDKIADESAPIRINFYGNGKGNDPGGYYFSWYIYRLPYTAPSSSDWGEPIARYTDRDFYYTFDQSGNYRIKLEVANQNSECILTNQIEFKISDSDLNIPNFFTPGDSPGIHDEWKVYHKSIVKFRCTIFNRWGVKLYQYTDPDGGWDGRYKGKRVKPGVYFYVIEATGSDGKRWKEMGDINILK